MSTRIITSMMNKICIRAPNLMRQMAIDTIWISLPFCTNCVFYILWEVGAERKKIHLKRIYLTATRRRKTCFCMDIPSRETISPKCYLQITGQNDVNTDDRHVDDACHLPSTHGMLRPDDERKDNSIFAVKPIF